MLIIDEISMVDADLFDKLDYVARVVRGKDSPFGGVQLVCCGDFFQVQASRRPPRMLRPLSLSLFSPFLLKWLVLTTWGHVACAVLF